MGDRDAFSQRKK
jgi:hypothetical protein